MIMEFLLLGRMIVTVDGRAIDLGRRRERFILGLLLLDTGKVITIDRLIDLLWEGEAPDDPRAAVQVHISRLRRSLADAGAGPSGAVIRYLADGYLVEADPNAVDAHRFAAAVRSARLANDAADRSAILTAALSLWRGEPLEDVVPAHLSGRLFEHLAEARRAALDMRIEADLALGRHESLIPELTRLGAENPTDERMAEARMRALCKVGRQPEALAVYQNLADGLSQEFGLDPSPRLRALRTAILRDENLAADQSDRVRPAQLPAEASDFHRPRRGIAGAR